MDEFAAERYRQRYETWRHLDKIRYQIIQLAIGIAGAFALVIRATNAGLPAWLLIIIAVIFGLLWQILRKVNQAIRHNGAALRVFGAHIGDDQIPDVSDRDRSIFFYIESLFAILAVFFVLAGAVLGFGSL